MSREDVKYQRGCSAGALCALLLWMRHLVTGGMLLCCWPLVFFLASTAASLFCCALVSLPLPSYSAALIAHTASDRRVRSVAAVEVATHCLCAVGLDTPAPSLPQSLPPLLTLSNPSKWSGSRAEMVVAAVVPVTAVNPLSCRVPLLLRLLLALPIVLTLRQLSRLRLFISLLVHPHAISPF